MKQYEQAVWSFRQRALQRWTSARPAGPVKHLVGSPASKARVAETEQLRERALAKLEALNEAWRRAAVPGRPRE